MFPFIKPKREPELRISAPTGFAHASRVSVPEEWKRTFQASLLVAGKLNKDLKEDLAPYLENAVNANEHLTKNKAYPDIVSRVIPEETVERQRNRREHRQHILAAMSILQSDLFSSYLRDCDDYETTLTSLCANTVSPRSPALFSVYFSQWLMNLCSVIHGYKYCKCICDPDNYVLPTGRDGLNLTKEMEYPKYLTLILGIPNTKATTALRALTTQAVKERDLRKELNSKIGRNLSDWAQGRNFGQIETLGFDGFIDKATKLYNELDKI